MLYFSNFMLDILNSTAMNKTKILLALMILGTITFGLGFWLYGTMSEIQPFHYATLVVVLLVVLVGLLVGIKRLKEEKKGLTADDELSRRTKEKAAAHAFVGSFYLWALLLAFTVDSNIAIEIPLGIGLLGMGIMFLGFYAYYHFKGIDSANPN